MSEHQAKLSVILIANTPSRQLLNTLYSLSVPYQWNVSGSDYEIIVVDCRVKSEQNEKALKGLSENIHYYPMQAGNNSVLKAVEYGLAQAQGEFIGLMMEGAAVVSPRVIEYALMGLLMNPKALVLVPSYNIGQKESAELIESNEENLLDEVQWRENGYRLFSVSTVGEETPRGFFHPMIEANGLFFAAERFEQTGSTELSQNAFGIWGLKLFFYHQLALQIDTSLTILIGEGCFKQCTADATVGEHPQWHKDIPGQLEQLKTLWGGEFNAVRKEPLCLGAVSSYAQPHLHHASQMAVRRFKRLEREGEQAWIDDRT